MLVKALKVEQRIGTNFCILVIVLVNKINGLTIKLTALVINCIMMIHVMNVFIRFYVMTLTIFMAIMHFI